MARMSPIFRVFAELRRARPEIPAREVLRLAALIVKAHREPESFEIDARAERRAFVALDVDTAFRQANGWRVVDFERRQGMPFGDEIPGAYYRVPARLSGLLGRTSWPRTGTD